mgnify:FL=1
MKPKMDMIAGIFLFVFSVIMYYASFSIKILMVSRIGSRFVPQLLAIAMGILSLVLVVQSLLRMKTEEIQAREKKGGSAAWSLRDTVPIWGTFLALIVYAVTFEPLGFIVSTTLYLLVQFYLLTSMVKRKHLVFLISAVLTSVVVYFIFVKVFYLMLPEGILG